MIVVPSAVAMIDPESGVSRTGVETPDRKLWWIIGGAAAIVTTSLVIGVLRSSPRRRRHS